MYISPNIFIWNKNQLFFFTNSKQNFVKYHRCFHSCDGILYMCMQYTADLLETGCVGIKTTNFLFFSFFFFFILLEKQETKNVIFCYHFSVIGMKISKKFSNYKRFEWMFLIVNVKMFASNLIFFWMKTLKNVLKNLRFPQNHVEDKMKLNARTNDSWL